MMQLKRLKRPRYRTALASLVFAFALTTCDHPAAGPGGRAALAVQVVMPASPDLALFNLTIDNVRLIVVRPPSDTVFNQVFFFPPDQTDLPLEADIPMQTSPETFRVTIELLSGTQVLFSGTQDVSLDEGTTNPPAQLPVTYSGPGQNVASLSIGPVDSVLTQGGTLQFRLTAQDAQGAPVSTFYASWTTSDTMNARVDATGLLTAPFSRSSVNVLARTPSNVSVSTPITFVPAPIAINIVSGCGQSGSPGAQLPQPIVARVVAGDGLGVKGVQVQFTAPTGGSVATPLVVTDDNGLAQTLATLPPQGAAAFSIGSTGLTPVQCNQTVLGATHLVFSVQPSSIVAGGPITVAVTAMDALGTPVTSFSGAVNLALATNPGGITFGTPAVVAAAGVATFSGFTITRAAAGYSFLASSGGLTPATSIPFNVVAAAPAQLAFTVSPPPLTVTQGVPIVPPPQVVIQDSFGNSATTATDNVTIDIGANPGGSVLGGTPTQAALAGVATFPGLTLNEVGTGYTLIATSGNLTPATSASFNVVPLTGLHLVFTTQPSNVGAGSVMIPPVVVTVQDAQNNTATSFNGNVTLGLGNCGTASLLGTTTIAAAAGVATFADLRLDRSGPCILVASSASLQSVVSANFTVTPGPAAQLAFTVQPSNVAAGAVISPIVRVEIHDTLGNTVTTATDDVTMAIGSNPGSAVLGGTLAKTAASGVALFTDLTLDKAGTGYTLIATSGSLAAATSTPFTVTGGAVTHFAVVVPPSVTAGVPATVTVTAQDAANNTVTDYAGTVAFTSSDQQATLPANYTFVAGDNGTHTFTSAATLRTQGSQSITAADVVTPSITGSASVTVIAASASALAFTVQPGSITAGANFAPTVLVTARDAFGNTATTFAGTVSLAFANNPSQATLLGTLTVTAAAGVASFANVSVDKTGSGYTLSATASGLSPATSAAFNVTAGVATQLAFLVQPSTVVQGASIAPPVQVAIQDQFGNTVTTSTDQVTMTIGTNPGSATLGGTLIQTASAGVATFGDLTLSAPGSGYTLMAVASGFASIESASFGVTVVGATPNAWTAAAGGTWSTPANWSLARVPQASDSVVISLSGTYTVTLDTTVSIAFLTFGASSGIQTFAMAGRTLTVTSAVTIESATSATVNNGTLGGVGAISNQGSMTLVSTTINAALTNQGTLIVHGSNAVNGALTTVAGAGSVLRVEGANATGTGTLTVLNGFTNTAAIELTNANVNQAAQLLVTNGTLANTGTISALPGATGGARTLSAQLDNQAGGTLTVGQALTLSRTGATHTNAGTITLSGGNLTLQTSTSFTNTGTVNIASGLVWLINGVALNQNAGAINGPGTLDLTSLTANFPAGFSNATLGLNLNNVTVTGGTLTNASGQTLTLLSSTINAPLSTQGTLIIHGSNTVNGALTTVAGAGSVIRVEGANATGTGTLTVLNGFTNTAAIELTNANINQAAQLLVTNGILANTGTISALAGATGGARTLTAHLDNQVGGTLTVGQALTLSRTGATHTNAGTITLSGGNLTLQTSTSFTNTGTVNVASGLVWLINGVALNQNAGAINGPGTLDLTSLTASFPAGFSNATLGLNLNNVTVTGGTLTNAATRTLTLTSSTINAPLSNQGTLIVHGSNAVNGALTTVAGAGSVIRVEGANATGTGTLTVLNGFTNTAAIELTNANVNQAAQLIVSNGTLANTGTISALAGATGGARTLTAQLDNQVGGTLTVGQALTLSRTGATHTNAGTITLSGGNLTLQTSTSFTNTGTVTIGSGLVWLISGVALNQNAGGINGPGTLDLTSLTVSFPAGFSNATLGLNLNNATVTTGGTLTNAATRTLTLASSTINSPLANQGTLIIHGSNAVNGALTTVAGAGSVIRVEGANATGTGTLTVLNGFTNTAVIEMTNANVNQAAQLIVTNGTLANTGTISALPGATGGARTLTAQLDNQGTVTVSQALTLTFPAAGQVNSGLIQLAGGDLTVVLSGFRPGFANDANGIIDVGTNKLVINNQSTGTFLNNAGGTLRGSGTIDIGTASFITNGIVTIGTSPGVLNWVGTYLQGPDPSVFRVEIGGNPLNPGVDYDQFLVSDNVTLQGGTLDVTLIGPVAGQTYVIMQVPAGKTITGDFQTKLGLVVPKCTAGVSGTAYLIVCP